jgi:type IV secretory pathway TraG/TraD family ATPase VirD4
MNSDPVEPRTTAGLPMAPWVVIGLLYTGVGVSWLAWAAGRITAALAGSQPGPPFGSEFLRALLSGQWDQTWPGVHPGAAAAVYLVLLAAAAAPVTGVWVAWRRRRTRAGDPLPSMAMPRDLAALTPAGVAARARQLRPSLAHIPARRLAPELAGMPLGKLVLSGRRTGPMLRASWEDVLVAMMGPRTGKTTGLAVPVVLSAPGPTLATSVKPDLWETTGAARAERGSVWNFDPQGITGQPQSWWWNPLAHVTGVEEAGRFADHFVQEITKGKGDDFWVKGARGVISAMVLAAAVSGRTLQDVQQWLSQTTNTEPAEILLRHGYAEKAHALRGRQAGAPETREGTFETARTAAVCLEDPAIMRWVTPPSQPLPGFDLNTFIGSTDTLYLHSTDNEGAPSPLVAAFTDQVFQTAVRHARHRGGRIDPPLIGLLDEAANICRIGDLPKLYSFMGSHGVCIVTVLQSWPQGTQVWGDRGMAALWSAATVKLVGAGTDDAKFAEDVSRLVGEHDVATASRTRDVRGGLSYQVGTQRRRILDPGQVRALPRGTAILLASGAKPALIRPQPWYQGPDAARLAADTEAAVAQIAAWSQAASTPTTHTEQPLPAGTGQPSWLRYDRSRARSG